MTNLVKIVGEYTKKVEQIWSEIGLDVSQQNERTLFLIKKIEDMLKDFLNSVQLSFICYQQIINFMFVLCTFYRKQKKEIN